MAVTKTEAPVNDEVQFLESGHYVELDGRILAGPYLDAADAQAFVDGHAIDAKVKTID